ncbi:MAG: hypothetical protein M5T61_13465 [Acidimicrobiia bacterium]|nr:hypothetical protein [Acidimicrobiia bacterium]
MSVIASRATSRGERRASGFDATEVRCSAPSSAQVLRGDGAEGRVGLQVDGVHREAEPSDPVGDGMVDLLEQGCASVGQPLDQGELPERPRSVERGLGESRHEVEEVAHPSR